MAVRLIGLRVTKLKDLRAPPEPMNGIKRFFGPLSEQSRSAKKVKTEHQASNLDLKDLVDSGDTMPGFHELDEEDHMLHIDVDDDCDSEPIVPAEDTRQSIVAPTAPSIPGGTNTDTTQDQALAPRSVIPSTKKPQSSRPTALLDSRQSEIAPIETHSCPLCGKTLRVDNQGLNTHIDFCLSRGAIRQAHAEASNSTSPVKAQSFGLKPISKTKGKSKK
ncbi:hypothetical protein H0H92_011642 [Tricholoma furcatifolium]|nr:hypothetical protein H0H92_011642 [Tricholoma furcatifolium]